MNSLGDHGPPAFAQLPPQGFVRLPTVLKLIPVGRSTIFEMIARGDFPRPVKLSQRVSAWRCEDVIAFIKSRRCDTDL